MQLLGGLGAGLAIIALLIAWQLHKGPVSLGFLTPYVEQALNAGHSNFRLAIADTTLTWAGWDRAVELRVKNVRAIGENGKAVARIPELSMSLSGRALLHGQLAPKFIELLGPEVRIRRDATGSVDVALVTQEDTAGDQVARGLLGWLLHRPEPKSPMSYLQTVRISGATMTFDDQLRDKSWQVPVGYLRLDRAPHGLLAEGSVLVDVDGQVSDISLHGSYRMDDEHLDISASFSEIKPASFAALDDKLNQLEAVDLSLSGTLVVGMTLKNGIETVGFNVAGAKGALNLPAPLGQILPIESLKVRGIVNGKSETVTIDELTVKLPVGAELIAPAPIAHAFPLRAIEGKGSFNAKQGVLEVTALNMELDGPKASITGTMSGIGSANGMSVQAHGHLTDVLMDEVKRHWPKSLGTDAYVWVTEHLSKGRLLAADAEIDLNIDADGTLTIVTLDGTMTADGADVLYMPGMPPVTDAAALMTFDAQNFDIAVERGHTGDVSITGGTIHISGLDAVDQFADVNLRIRSPFKSVLQLIDRKPLGFAKAMGIKPAGTDGNAAIDLALNLLLAKDLKLDDLKVEAHATLDGVAIDNVVLGRGIRDGKLKLSVDKAGMDVHGSVRMGAIPVNLKWRENFAAKAPFLARYEMAAAIDNIRNVSDLGVHPPGIALDKVSGGIDASVIYTVFDKRLSRVEVSADMARAEVNIPELRWRKAPGDPGQASVKILVENGVVKRVPDFEVVAKDLLIRGDVAYSPGGLGLDRVNLGRVKFGRSDVTGAVLSRADGGWEVGLHGPSLDIAPIWDRIMRNRSGDKDLNLPDLTLALEVDKLWIDPERFMTDLSGTLVYRGDYWRTVFLSGDISGGSALDIRMTPDDSGDRILTVKAADAGETLRFLDLFGNMYGGNLEIRGRYDDAAPGRPLKGEMRVVDYRVRKAPMLTRILSIMALTGIVDALTGDGLNFATLDVPFVMHEGEVQITDAKATGTSIGFTASGSVYTHADVINLGGTVVPAYALNSLFGKIPLLGNILTGSESGGGVFAANFSVSGPIEDPKTTVNPLSALTPGILRNLFGVLKPDQIRLLSDPTESDSLLGAPSN